MSLYQEYDAAEKAPIINQEPHQAVAYVPAVPVIATAMVKSPVQTGLFDCAKDWRSCLEGYFCGYCQNSRQYNVMKHEKNDMHAGACFLPFVTDIALPIAFFLVTGIHGMYGIGTMVMTYMNRRSMHRRYNLDTTDCGDFMSAWCCSPCSTCQVYREMSVRNEWPAGFCVQQPYALPAPVQQMH
jgi:Cys-rich protein (TIGR01571 family)